jgi:hypothetical protein
VQRDPKGGADASPHNFDGITCRLPDRRSGMGAGILRRLQWRQHGRCQRRLVGVSKWRCPVWRINYSSARSRRAGRHQSIGQHGTWKQGEWDRWNNGKHSQHRTHSATRKRGKHRRSEHEFEQLLDRSRNDGWSQATTVFSRVSARPSAPAHARRSCSARVSRWSRRPGAGSARVAEGQAASSRPG